VERCRSREAAAADRAVGLKGHVTSTKGGRVRLVPMTVRLATALRQHRHLRGRRVLVQATGEPVTQKIVQVSIRRAARSAHVKEGVHIPAIRT
jgi:integrase